MASKTSRVRAPATSKASMAQVLTPAQALARSASRTRLAARNARHQPSGLTAAARLARAYQQRAVSAQALYARQRTFQQASAQRQSVALRQRAARRLYLGQSVYSRQQFIIRGLLGVRSSRAVRLATARFPLPTPWAIPYRRQLSLSGARARAATAATATRKASTTRSTARTGRRSKPRKAASALPATAPRWITAGNDAGEENCASVAIANHLLATAGIRITDEDVRRLSELHDGDLRDALRAMLACQPWRHRALLSAARPATAPGPGQVWGFETAGGPHAALSTGEAMIASWGEESPFTGEVEEAYQLAWTVANPSRTRKP